MTKATTAAPPRHGTDSRLRGNDGGAGFPCRPALMPSFSPHAATPTPCRHSRALHTVIPAKAGIHGPHPSFNRDSLSQARAFTPSFPRKRESTAPFVIRPRQPESGPRLYTVIPAPTPSFPRRRDPRPPFASRPQQPESGLRLHTVIPAKAGIHSPQPSFDHDSLSRAPAFTPSFPRKRETTAPLVIRPRQPESGPRLHTVIPAQAGNHGPTRHSTTTA